MIETERLVLRAYREEDRDAFAALTGDPRVGYWVASVKDRAQSDVMMDRLNAHIAAHGYGLWGVARKTDDKIIGLCGLDPIAQGDLPVGPGVEMAWRMIPQVWRRSPAEAQSLTAAALADRRASPEGQEGIRAFLEKRKPSWSVASRATETRSHGE